MYSDNFKNYRVDDKFKDSAFTAEFVKLGNYIVRKLTDECTGFTAPPMQPLLPYIGIVDDSTMYLAYSRYPNGANPVIYIQRRLVVRRSVQGLGISNIKMANKCRSYLTDYATYTRGVNVTEANAIDCMINYFKTKPALYLINEPKVVGNTFSFNVDAIDGCFSVMVAMGNLF